jgi:hypothetical protein
MELDDETDEDTLSILLDKQPPSGVTFVTANDVPGNAANIANAQVRGQKKFVNHVTCYDVITLQSPWLSPIAIT